MNHDDEAEPSAFAALLLEVLDGRRPVDDPELRAAMAADPDFAAEVAGALRVAAALARLRAAETEARSAPPGPLDAVAVAAARAGLGLPPRVRPAWVRRWPWLALALAAGVALAAVLWDALVPGPPTDSPTHLGGAPAVVATVEGTELRLAPAPAAGQHYRIEFLVGDRVVDSVVVRGRDRLSLPDLRGYGAGVQVRATWMQGDQELAPSILVPLPPGTGR